MPPRKWLSKLSEEQLAAHYVRSLTDTIAPPRCWQKGPSVVFAKPQGTCAICKLVYLPVDLPFRSLTHAVTHSVIYACTLARSHARTLAPLHSLSDHSLSMTPREDASSNTLYRGHVQGWTDDPYKMNMNLAVIKETGAMKRSRLLGAGVQVARGRMNSLGVSGCLGPRLMKLPPGTWNHTWAVQCRTSEAKASRRSLILRCMPFEAQQTIFLRQYSYLYPASFPSSTCLGL